MEPGRELFDAIRNASDVEAMIASGEAEGLHLECKAPGGPQLDRGLRSQLAEAASGFANSGGGVILWGVSTVRHQASGLDVLTQLEPIGQARRFAQQVDRAARTSTMPALPCPPSKVLHPGAHDSKGLVVTCLPPTEGDPVQALPDQRFYFRNGDEFVQMPYEMLRRMFAGAAGPDLQPVLDGRLVQEVDGGWQIPFAVMNASSAAADGARVSVEILNPEACAAVVVVPPLRDVSQMNPGKRIFMADLQGRVYRGMNMLAGQVNVTMERKKRPRRVLRLELKLFADRMRARRWLLRIQLAKSGFSVRSEGDASFLY